MFNNEIIYIIKKIKNKLQKNKIKREKLISLLIK